MKLLIATKNPGKFEEIAHSLRAPSAGGVRLELFSLADLGLSDDVEEHGKTHEENAILKARHFFEKTKLPTLGEDSGIEVDAFPGELGVQTRRWEGLGEATDEQWIAHFLHKMETVPLSKRTAKFICCAALILDEGSFKKPHIFSDETRGVITEKLEAPLRHGVPLSSCFKPDGFKKVFAALSHEEKNKISHRGKTMAQVKLFLQKFLV